MKKRTRRKRKTIRQRDISGRKRPATQNDQRKRQWPELSLEELTENRVGSADRAALAAEYIAVKQLPVCRADIGDWPVRKRDQNGGD